MLRKGHGDLYKAPAMEESERWLRGDTDQIKLTQYLQWSLFETLEIILCIFQIISLQDLSKRK